MNTRLSKMISILAIVSLLSAGSILAQSRNSDNDWQKGPPSVEERLARISAALNLDSQQSLEMHTILQEQAENRAALHEQAMAMLGPEICAQRAEQEEAILTILDPEQTELFMQIKQERQANANRKGRGGKRMSKLNCED